MRLQDMQNLLDIPVSTLSDWDKNPKRQKLMKLLRALDIEDVETLLEKEAFTPKYSPRTRKIKLHKEWFAKDLLYSREDGSIIEIDNLIAIYLKQPNQKDTNKLLYLFGSKRVKKVLDKIKTDLDEKDYKEAKEQIEYALSANEYKKHHKLPSISEIVKEPKERYVELLQKQYSKEEILSMAVANNASYPSLFKLKKVMGYEA